MKNITYTCDFCNEPIVQSKDRRTTVSGEFDFIVLGLSRIYMHSVCFYKHNKLLIKIRKDIKKLYFKNKGELLDEN